MPGCWTMQGSSDHPHYLNVRMPFRDLPPRVPAANPTGLYEREVEVPERWAGRRIVLYVGGAESVLIARVNGREAGISKDSHLAAEFDVTELVRPGPNTVSLMVIIARLTCSAVFTVSRRESSDWFRRTRWS